MASQKNQKEMVLYHKGATTSAATPAANQACMMEKANMLPSKEPTRNCSCPAVKDLTGPNFHPDSLSPDSICNGIRVTLDNNNMWNEFFRCKTEMIVTKQGSRMFPYCRFRISGLQPLRKYSLIMDIQPLDNNHYKWTGKSWQVAGKAERYVKSQPFAHPDSPSTGQHWMQNPVSFYKLKLTNNTSEQEGIIMLHPMHCYLPRLHVVQNDKATNDVKIIGPSVVTFAFPQTEFMAVTAYQNPRFAQLKINYNPFAKGLKDDGSSSLCPKLKLTSGNDFHRDEGTTAYKHHPMKRSLKFLLTNHKPRSAKAADSKSSVPDNLLKNSTENKDQSTAKAPAESLCSSSGPAQNLLSDLVREARVSLQRCNLDQLKIHNSTSHRNETTNSKATNVTSNKDVPKKDTVSIKTQSERTSAKNSETKPWKSKDNAKTNSFEGSNVTGPVEFSNSDSVESNYKPQPRAPIEVNVKQRKRPAPLPLPALALFLKQHLTKCKAKNKPDAPPGISSESLSGAQSSDATSEYVPVDHTSSAAGPSKDLTDSKQVNVQVHTIADICTSGQVVETALYPCSPPCLEVGETKVAMTDYQLVSSSVSESPNSELALSDGTPVLTSLDRQVCTNVTYTSPIPSTVANSSAAPILLPPVDTVLNSLNSPQTLTITESSTLPLDSLSTKSDSLLPDQECSFSFESLSPANSPDSLAPLPVSLALELQSTTSEPALKTKPVEELLECERSPKSVFKWHTVLPPPLTYIDTSFTTFKPTSPLLPCPTPSHTEPQSLETPTPVATPDSVPSFQENDQSLAFPAELSPLVLQLPLSPTFSSLDGDGLSPTSSIADLVHFFSTNDDLGMGGEFSSADVVEVTCPPPTAVDANAQEPSQPVQGIPAKKLCKSKKKSRQGKLIDIDVDQKTDDSTYTTMQPNLEEVEEQLFVSFTSKEALKLHITDFPEDMVPHQTTAEDNVLTPSDTPENESVEKICTCEKILLKDLKLMRHKQVIHPVLQEVGLKMNLLDPTLAIDLQYLGVRLPIPPPGVSLEQETQELAPSQGVSAAFVSRTGKTSDMTQIKGWREKFTPSDALLSPSSTQPEAGPSSDLPKKNLSAFCSDMLDEYLENEGKLIDERAASFSQPSVVPVVYKLPARSTSYVRTLDSVLKKHTIDSPTSDLISGFIPPSKRPKLSFRETKLRKERKQKRLQHTELGPEPTAAQVSTPEPGPTEPTVVPKGQTAPSPAAPTHSEQTAPITESQMSKRKKQLQVPLNHIKQLTLSSRTTAFRRMKKLKPKTSPLRTSRPTAPLTDISDSLAPIESDSELGPIDDEDDQTNKDNRPMMTRALLRQKDLEDAVVWEGRERISITAERAAIALTSLFTLKGFVSENPTAPIQLVRRRAPPCLNEFCRLGCICSSLSHCFRISHCGRPTCMFGCSCLKQKVVLLKNLDGSDSSPSHHGTIKRKRRKRRMKMAYILKEADSVSHPAEQVRVLWKRDGANSDPDPTYIPLPPSLMCPNESRDRGSCARVRVYEGKRMPHKHTDMTGIKKPKARVQQKAVKHRDLIPEETLPDEPTQQVPSPPPQPTLKPSKRLIILADCKWASDADQNQVLKRLCKVMALDQLDSPFWIGKYLISPISRTVEETDQCMQYKVHVSRPRMEPEINAVSPTPLQQENVKKEPPQQENVKKEPPQQENVKKEPPQQENVKKEPPQQENVKKEPPQQENVKKEPPQQENVKKEPLQQKQDPLREMRTEGEHPKDCQQGVPEAGIQEEERSAHHRVRRWSQRSERKRKQKIQKLAKMALPFLTGISPAGFLSAERRKAGGTDHLVQVNGKLYPLAKIQLGKMGALHPANRLAAYLTGRVGSSRKQLGSSSSSHSSKSPQMQSSGSSPQSSFTATLTAPPPRPPLSVRVLTLPTSSSVLQPGATGIYLPAGGASEVANNQVITVKWHPRPACEVSQFRPVTDGSAPSPASQVNSSVAPPVDPCVRSLVAVSGSAVKLPVWGLDPQSSGQKMVLQPVHTSSGVQYYRTSGGKLVQLLPINKITPVKSTPPLTRGPPPPSVVPCASFQSPAYTVVNQTSAGVSQTASIVPVPPPSSSSSSLSGSASLTSPLHPVSGFLSETGLCSAKVIPTNSNKEPIIITCPPPTPHPPISPVNLISPKPSIGQGAEIRVKALTMSADMGAVSVSQKPASSQTSTTSLTTAEKNQRGPPSSPLPGCEVTPGPLVQPSAESEPVTDPENLDIVCVDPETVRPSPKAQLLDADDVELTGSLPSSSSTSGDTENSSDFEEDSSYVEEKVLRENQRYIHNMLEKQRRGKMFQLFKALRRAVGLTDHRTPKIATLKTAVQIIQDLRTTETRLKKQKRRLKKRRDKYLSTVVSKQHSRVSSYRQRRPWSQSGADALEVDQTHKFSDEDRDSSITDSTERHVNPMTHSYIRRVPQRSAEEPGNDGGDDEDDEEEEEEDEDEDEDEDEELTSMQLQSLTTIQRETMKQETHPEVSQMSAPLVGGSSDQTPAGSVDLDIPTVDTPEDDEVLNTSSNLQQPMLQAPPITVFAPLTATPVQQPVHTFVQPSHSVLQVSQSIQAPPVTHNAPVVRERLRTIPNILSRSRKPTRTVQAPSIQALVPAKILTLVGAALPGQQILTLRSVMGGPAVMQTTPTSDVDSVTLNIPSLTSQHIHFTSALCPPAGKINSSSAPLSSTDQTVFNLASAGSDLISDQAKDQNQNDTGPGSNSSSCPPSTPHQGLMSSQFPGLRADRGVEVRPEEPLDPAQQPDVSGDGDKQGLVSPLDEIDFLNQRIVSTAITQRVPHEVDHVVDGAKEEGCTQSLQLDCDNTVTMETEEPGLEGQSEVAHPGPQTGSAHGKAPPPLLHMNVSRAAVADPTCSDGAAMGGGGVKMKEASSWRPMPRLVPLGLRGNLPS